MKRKKLSRLTSVISTLSANVAAERLLQMQGRVDAAEPAAEHDDPSGHPVQASVAWMSQAGGRVSGTAAAPSETVPSDRHRTDDMQPRTSRHWPEYLIEAACLALFMVSAAGFATLLQHPASPVAAR